MTGSELIGLFVGGAVAITVIGLSLRENLSRAMARRRLGRGDVLPPEPDAVAPRELAALGLTSPFTPASGSSDAAARGMIDGVEVQAIRERIGVEDGVRVHYRLAIPLAIILPPELTLRHEGMRASSDDLELGDARFDERFVVLAPRNLAVLHLNADARRYVVDAADAGWSVERDRLVRARLPEESLRNYLVPGVAAARSLRVDDAAKRFAAIVAGDPIARMRRRALTCLVVRHAADDATAEALATARQADDPVLALIATPHRPALIDWLTRAATLVRVSDGIIELCEHMAEVDLTEALPMLGDLLTRDISTSERRTVDEARRRLRARSGAIDGGLSLASGSDPTGALALAPTDDTSKP